MKTILFVLILSSFSQVIFCQHGATCAERIQELYPRQLLDLDRLQGEWMAITVAWRNDSLVQEPIAKCASQIITRQQNTTNLDITLKYDLLSDGTHVERTGQVNVSISNPSIWKWGYDDNRFQSWEGVIISTDYTRFWIHYECEDQSGFRIESAVFRHRDRVVGPGQIDIFRNLLEGLGYPMNNFVDIPQPSDC